MNELIMFDNTTALIISGIIAILSIAFAGWTFYRGESLFLVVMGTFFGFIAATTFVIALTPSADIPATIQRDYTVSNVAQVGSATQNRFILTDDTTGKTLTCDVATKGHQYTMNCLDGTIPTKR